MDQTELVNVVISLQNAKDEWEILSILDNTEAFSEQTIQEIGDWTQSARDAGVEKEVSFWEGIEEIISSYRNQAQLRAQVAGREPLDIIPTSSTPQTRWAKLFRQYLDIGDRGLLSQAADAASMASDPAVVEILRAHEVDDFVTVQSIAPKLYDLLKANGHEEEAGTVALSDLYVDIFLINEFREYPLEEQSAALLHGISAAQRAMVISQRMNDEPCTAFFISALGGGFEHEGSLEEAEFTYKASIKIREKLVQESRDVFEPSLSLTQNNLGNVLLKLGRAEEAEAVIRAALTIRKRLANKDREKFGPKVAMTQNNLGNVLQKLGKLEQAKSTYRAALVIYEPLSQIDPAIFEQSIALIQSNLGDVFVGLGDLEEALSSYQLSLDIRNRLAIENPKMFEQEIALTHNNLGRVLRKLHRFEESKSAFESALAIYKPLAEIRASILNPNLAMMQHNLGSVLREMGLLKKAKVAFQAALDIREKLAQDSPSTYEISFASTLNNLGNVLQRLGQLKEAKEMFQKSMGICKRLAEVNPEKFESFVAATMNNMGMVLQGLGQIKEAKSAFEDSIKEYEEVAKSDPKTFEPTVAIIQRNLGNALQELSCLDEAKAIYETALSTFEKYEIIPYKVDVLTNLSDVFIAQSCWQDAIERLHEAVSLTEEMRAEVLSLSRQTKILKENFGAYENLMICLIELGRFDEALEIAEQGKSRTLIDLMASKDVQPQGETPPELVEEYKRILWQVRGLVDDSPMATMEPNAPPRLSLEEAYRCYDETVAQIRRYDPDFLVHAQPLKHAQILDLARDANATLVLFRVTERGTFVFLVFPDGTTDVVTIPEFTVGVLNDLVARFDEKGNAVSGWLVDYTAYRNSSDVEALEAWQNTMESTLEKLGALLMEPIRTRLRDSTDLILVPNRALAILPLHACPWIAEEGEQARYWGDKFNIRYAPSLTIFQRCLAQDARLRQQRQEVPDTLLGVINPEKNLAAALWEGKEIERLMGAAQCLMLWEDEATRESLDRELRGQLFVHFSCHGTCDMRAPLSSALGLAGDKNLTLGDIFESLSLPTAWLVVLSACETGLADWNQTTDEHYGLATGFLYAGVPTVYASLWAVDDGSTALLMVHVYELLKTTSDKAGALRQSAKWLRELTAREIEIMLRDSPHGAAMRAMMEEFSPDSRPFDHPVWWAAFQCVGV